MDFTVKETEKVYHGSRIVVFRDFIEQPDGSEVTREVVTLNNAAAIVPLTDEGEVVLINQFRYCVARQAQLHSQPSVHKKAEQENGKAAFGKGMLVEIPAGTFEEGEEPEECARREIEEETGYRAGKLTRLGQVYTSPGVCTEVIHLFLAEQLEKGDQDLDHGEVIELLRVKLEDALAMIADGRIIDAKTVCGLLLTEKLLKSRG